MRSAAGHATVQEDSSLSGMAITPEWKKALRYLEETPNVIRLDIDDVDKRDKRGKDRGTSAQITTQGLAGLQPQNVRLIPANFTDDAQHKIFHQMHVLAEFTCAKDSNNWKILRHHMPLSEDMKCREHLQNIQAAGGHADFVVTKEHGTAGCAIYYPCLAAPGKTSKHGYLHLVGLLPEVRGMGVGKMVMQKIEKTLGEKGCEIVTLDVAENNHKLMEWYQSQGWEYTDIKILQGYVTMHKCLAAAALKPKLR